MHKIPIKRDPSKTCALDGSDTVSLLYAPPTRKRRRRITRQAPSRLELVWQSDRIMGREALKGTEVQHGC